MLRFHKVVASVFGIGFVKGGGTLAATVTCIVWYLIPAGYHTDTRQFFITAFVTVLGVWSGNVVDAAWGKDSNKVVIDEVSGMMIALLFIPVRLPYILIGLVLFRFFDIAKPLYIRRMEAFPKGLGVMADDVLAGIYSNILLFVISHFIYKIP